MIVVILIVLALAGLAAMHVSLKSSVRSEMYDNGYDSQQ